MTTTLKMFSAAALAVALSACVVDNGSDDGRNNAAAEADAAAEGRRWRAGAGRPVLARPPGTRTGLLPHRRQHAAPAADARPIRSRQGVGDARARLRDPTAELRVPFHVGDNLRTWILTRTDSGLRLKHDHRHEDGSDDPVTMYGSDTATPGTAARQNSRSTSTPSTCSTRATACRARSQRLGDGDRARQRFTYELARPQGS